MSTEDDILTGLYTQRQEILKQLADVDTKIKIMEAQMQEKFIMNSSNRSNSNNDFSNSNGSNGGSVFNGGKIGFENSSTGQPEAADIIRVIEECMRDAAGLRHALKIVGCLKDLHENPQQNDKFAQKVHYRNVFVHESLSHVRELAHDGNGSEFFQSLLSVFINGTHPPTLHDIEYDPILRHARSSSTDSQHIVNNDSTSASNDNCNKPHEPLSEIMMLINYLGHDYVTVSCNTNGARVAQKVIDCLITLEEFALFTETITSSVVELAKDINGSHSLAKLMTSARFKKLDQISTDGEHHDEVIEIYRRIYEPVAKECIDICKNRQGCCIIQKCLQWAPEPYHKSIMDTVLQNTLKLVQDPFGNYVVQFILDRQQEANNQKSDNGEGAMYTNKIITQMLHHVADLSCNKFSSNVIEKCLKTSLPHVRKLLVDELTDPKELPKLLTDSFANYVIQTAIATASDDVQFAQLRDAITPLQNLLKNSPYGVKIETKLARRHRESARRLTKKRDVPSTSSPSFQQNNLGQNISVPPPPPPLPPPPLPTQMFTAPSQMQQHQLQSLSSSSSLALPIVQSSQQPSSFQVMPIVNGNDVMSAPCLENMAQLQMFASNKMINDFPSSVQQQQQQQQQSFAALPPPSTFPPPPPPPPPLSSFQPTNTSNNNTLLPFTSSFANNANTNNNNNTSSGSNSNNNNNNCTINTNNTTAPSTPSETTYLTPSISTFNLASLPTQITPIFTSQQVLGSASFMLPDGQTMISIPQTQSQAQQEQQQQQQHSQAQQQQQQQQQQIPSSSMSSFSAANTLVSSPIPSTTSAAAAAAANNSATAGNFLMNVVNGTSAGANYWYLPVARS